MSCRINTGKSQSVSGMFYNDRRLCFCACNDMTWGGWTVSAGCYYSGSTKRLLNFFQSIGLCLNFRFLNARRLLVDATKATVKSFGHIGHSVFFFCSSIDKIHTYARTKPYVYVYNILYYGLLRKNRDPTRV